MVPGLFCGSKLRPVTVRAAHAEVNETTPLVAGRLLVGNIVVVAVLGHFGDIACLVVDRHP